MPLKPLTFIAMPFGKKKDNRVTIDFNDIYNNAIVPAIKNNPRELDYIRADEETRGGFIHGPMYERLLLSDIVIADLTLANPNVFYELGIRHTARPKSTILIFSKETSLPFDISPLRAIPYTLKKGQLEESEKDRLISEISSRLSEALEEGPPDSPLFQLINGFPGINLDYKQAESFRENLFKIESLHEKLADLRHSNDPQLIEKINEIEESVGHFDSSSYELLYDLLMSYRSVESWDDMIRLAESLPSRVGESIKVKEQLSLALNRRNKNEDRSKAIRILNSIIDNYGASSETLGILGRIYKDRYYEEKNSENDRAADGALNKAIEYYYKGFEEDPRDYYPGINALTLLFIENKETSKEKFNKLKPLVQFALERQGGIESKNYWVLASLLELASLNKDWVLANDVAGQILSMQYEKMEVATTKNNLNFILEKLKEREESYQELESIIEDLRED
ncbi:TRAFs-binding domain-containing protein [Alkalicoccus saliphilus]|uniref:DUF4071 domain-containing protein n=1 Tax=Alkalicoccus saliphilus TaxID=200989 RepID=A0A2T4U6R8_9BACI|nr:TRAFs-binding domain-containing protein [Alkalicoccus saliphilus]PTL39090.1 DUF4071 domain-containing protein [Alkalicoccus saliphilus]